MKKLISIILSLALVACMFAMNVGAELVVGDKDSDKALSAGDGWTDTEFDSNKSATADVTLTLGAVQSRYAVDITFSGDAYSFTANGLTWDVNNLTYVTTDEEPVVDKNYTFEVTNYSDKAVNVSAASEIEQKVSDAGVVANFTAVTGDTTNVADDKKSCTITGNANTTDGVANNATFSVTIHSDDWVNTINTLVGKTTETEFTLARFTVTIANPNT